MVGLGIGFLYFILITFVFVSLGDKSLSANQALIFTLFLTTSATALASFLIFYEQISALFEAIIKHIKNSSQ